MPAKKEIYLSDYAPPDFLVGRVALDVDIKADCAQVTAKLELRRNPNSKNKKAPLFLNGENQKLIALRLNGREVKGDVFRFSDRGLTLTNVPDKFTLEIVSEHNPYKNTALSGLYASGPMLVTQCEAEGFRRITYYPDRPDVMARFRVTIHADKKRFPVLLSNGNLIKSGNEASGRHFAVWEDPWPKPCYLFALVAGKFDKVTDRITTKSGRPVRIELYVEPGKSKETGFALRALKNAMRWDEKTFGLEYDLDRFMLVATPFFNMGAMENKGLNIFNDACVLGLPESATDGTISFIERVVGHEYFHNWTGDRITCRDWFQLSLKEGLTVFREQEFCGDMNSRAVERLGSVRALRATQFPEDAGPMAHAVRPDHYQVIDNFYTATVYEKGAEVARMIMTLVGRDGFRRGMKLYVKLHDGQAVTCEDFVRAMADANRVDLSQFMLWYSQAGTPVVKAASRYDAKNRTLTLDLRQSCPPTPKQRNKKPMHIPFAVGLLDKRGIDMIGTRVLSLKKPRGSFTFGNIPEKPVLSLLRDFSAPVRLVYPYTDAELLFLLAHDGDPFNRWEAAQKLFAKYLLGMIERRSTVVPRAAQDLFAALRALLRDARIDAAFKAFALSLPSEAELGLALRAKGLFIDPYAIYAARKAMILALGRALRADLASARKKLETLDPNAVDGASMGKRSLKNLCLATLAADHNPRELGVVFKQATAGKNMTDRAAALAILSDAATPLRVRAFAAFEERWRKNPTVMDKWLGLQASARRADVLAIVQKLMRHPAFDLKNPNRVSALIGAFASNSLGFHKPDGSGYRFVAETIKAVDRVNPQSAVRLAQAFARWRDYEPKRRALMKKALNDLAAHKLLSANCREVVSKSIGKN